MGANYERGILLYQTRQYKHAEKEFREELLTNPKSAPAHAMLGMTLTALHKGPQGHKEALEAVNLVPTYAYGHYTLSFTFASMNKPKEAEKAITEAIRLDPDEAYLFARAAQIQFWQKHYEQALLMAEAGLKQNPRHEECLINRAGALIELNRIDEAEEACKAALYIAPESSTAHINAGAVYLRKLDHVKAFEHYREALRLNPSSEQARTGVIEALKTRHKLYHFVLKFTLWFRRMPPWAIVLGLVFIIPPPTRMIMSGVVLLYAAANILFELTLHYDPVGKDFVKDRARQNAYVVPANITRLALAMLIFGFGIAIISAVVQGPDRVKRHQMNQVKQGPIEKPVDSLKFTDSNSYMEYIQRRIRRHWYPPYNSILYARCVVLFKVAQDGTVSNVRISESSGNDVLDKASIKAVSNASPLPQLPESMKGKNVDVQFTFDYNPKKIDITTPAKDRNLTTKAPAGT